MTDNLDSKNDAVVSKYFDIVQEEIKKLISQDKEIKQDEIERFNNEIFNQPVEIQDKIREYIDTATEKNLDIKKVAKVLYDKFKLQIKNNIYNQDDKQDVPNQLMGERKHIMTFEKFKLEN
jgi:5'-deoxynucleotidase YfbR-like HD superfamily hydrolase